MNTLSAISLLVVLSLVHQAKCQCNAIYDCGNCANSIDDCSWCPTNNTCIPTNSYCATASIRDPVFCGCYNLNDCLGCVNYNVEGELGVSCEWCNVGGCQPTEYIQCYTPESMCPSTGDGSSSSNLVFLAWLIPTLVVSCCICTILVVVIMKRFTRAPVYYVSETVPINSPTIVYVAAPIPNMLQPRTIPQTCTSCYGSGTKQCRTCEGSGYLRATISVDQVVASVTQVDCTDCSAKGSLYCYTCNGTGIIYY